MPRRGSGEGSIYKRPDGYWAASLELPSIDGKAAPKGRLREGQRRRHQAPARTEEEPRRTRRPPHRVDDCGAVVRLLAAGDRGEDAPPEDGRLVPVDHHSADPPGDRRDPPGQALPITVRKVLTAMEAAGRSSTYARNAHSIMSAAFQDAEREGRIPRNPVELVQAPRKAVPNLQALTLDESLALLDIFSGTNDGALWATFLLTGRGGVRCWGCSGTGSHPRSFPTRTLASRWSSGRSTCPGSCNGSRPGQTLPQGFEYQHLTNGLYLTRPKTRAGWRVIPLMGPLLDVMLRLRATAPPNEYGLVFTTQGGQPIDPDYVTKLWPRILEASGIDKRVRVHDIRHTTVDLLYAAGLDENDITAIVGHSSRAMSRSYRSKADQERLRVAMLKFTRSLER